MRKIMFWNDKGGIGKTTSAVNVTAALAELGYKALLIDAEPQCSATIAAGHFGIWRDENPPVNIFDLVLGKGSVKDAIIRNGSDKFDVITGTKRLQVMHERWSEVFEYHYALKRALAPLDELGYDFVVLDCAPMLVGVVQMCMAYADELYVPLGSFFYGTNAFADVQNTVYDVNDAFAPQLRLKGFFHTLVQNNSLTKRMMEATNNEAFNDIYMRTYIRFSVHLAASPESCKDIFSYYPKSNGAADYLALAKEIVAKGAAKDSSKSEQTA